MIPPAHKILINAAFLAFFGVFSLLFCSCMNTGKYLDYMNTSFTPAAKGEDQKISIQYANNGTFEGHTVAGEKHKIFPALLYWRVRNDYKITVDHYAAATYMAEYIRDAAAKLKASDMLGDRKMEISFRNIPGTFSYSERKHILVLLLGAADWTREVILPDTADLVAEVKLIAASGTIVAETIRVKSMQAPMKKTSIRKHYNYYSFLDNYRTSYHAELKRLAAELLKQVKW